MKYYTSSMSGFWRTLNRKFIYHLVERNHKLSNGETILAKTSLCGEAVNWRSMNDARKLNSVRFITHIREDEFCEDCLRIALETSLVREIDGPAHTYDETMPIENALRKQVNFLSASSTVKSYNVLLDEVRRALDSARRRLASADTNSKRESLLDKIYHEELNIRFYTATRDWFADVFKLPKDLI